MIFPVCSSHYHTKRGQLTGHYKRQYRGQIDGFGVYCPETDTCYLVPMNEVTSTQEMSLRVMPPKNNMVKGVRLAERFQISRKSGV